MCVGIQLVGMCHFVGISPLGTDAFLRSRLRKHLSQIKKDDYEIEQEGMCMYMWLCVMCCVCVCVCVCVCGGG